MKVSEIRELLTKYDQKELSTLVVEMYKAMPKKMREAKEIDALIKDVHLFKEKGKQEKNQDATKDFAELRQEIAQFINHAYNQYYFAPNSVVHKKERPKWRFKVKRYFKDLQMIAANEEYADAVVELLKKLYEMLCYSCSYYIFNTEDPFRSVGITQTEAYDVVISRKFSIGKNRESIHFAIDLLINNALDRETLYSSLMVELMKHLDIPDLKMIAIEQCKLYKEKVENPKYTHSNKRSDSSLSKYERENKINNLVEMIFRCYIELAEFDEAIHYFNQNYIAWDKEIRLYVLLSLLFAYELKDQWVAEYERALHKGIKVRESLSKMYQYIQDHGTFPAFIY